MNQDNVTNIEHIIAKIDNDFNPDQSDWIPRVGAWTIDALYTLKVLRKEKKRTRLSVNADGIAPIGFAVNHRDIKVYDKCGTEIHYAGYTPVDAEHSSTGEGVQSDMSIPPNTTGTVENQNPSYVPDVTGSQEVTVPLGYIGDRIIDKDITLSASKWSDTLITEGKIIRFDTTKRPIFTGTITAIGRFLVRFGRWNNTSGLVFGWGNYAPYFNILEEDEGIWYYNQTDNNAPYQIYSSKLDIWYYSQLYISGGLHITTNTGDFVCTGFNLIGDEDITIWELAQIAKPYEIVIPPRYNVYEYDYTCKRPRDYVITGENKDIIQVNFKTDFIWLETNGIETVTSETYGCDLPVIPNNGLLIEAITSWCMYKMLCRGYKHPVLNLRDNSPALNPYIAWIQLREKAITSILRDIQGEDINDGGAWRSNFYIETFDPKHI
jgi:hypothetical protein